MDLSFGITSVGTQCMSMSAFQWQYSVLFDP